MKSRLGARVVLLAAGAMLLQGTVLPEARAESPTDPWYADLYRLDEVWEQAQGEGVTVAVIDSGVDDSVPELEGQVLEGIDLITSDGAHVDVMGHGTDMASLIAGTGAGGGVRGLAPGAEILPIRMMTAHGEWHFDDEARMAEAIEYAVSKGARIINISMGWSEIGADAGQVTNAIAEAARNDVLIFAGTGNDALEGNESSFPADRDGVVGVAAVDRDGVRADYSTFGPQVALAAPGNDVPSRCPDIHSPLCLDSEGGTSSATALASGAAALVWSAHPEWTKNQVLRVLMETADGPEGAMRDQEIGFGVVRPDRVILDGEGDPGDPDTSPLFSTFERRLDPPVTPEPTAPEPAQEENGDEAAAGEDELLAEQADDGDEGGGGALFFGLAAAVLAAGIVAAVVMRRRGRASGAFGGGRYR
ncbi:S8 family serine peptidase [Streptomyces sp. RFCAC02]|uniref:S8 family serine peptidase n=1 Tax=Streptomyces sp. RFCAC02 TaxID=2499143 RepID=UPI0010226C33|nr:S8 family serine peptidase [Streptomyces sp. RFCAC02]